MKALFLPATLIFLAALSRPLDGSSPNLLANGGFEGGLQSWGRTENVTWSPAFGGAARIAQTPHAGWEALSQCAPVDGNALYVISASANLPRRPDGDGGLSVRVRWMDSVDCHGTILGGAPSLEFEPSRETLQTLSRVLVSPDGARSAVVQLVARADTSGTYSFVVDEVAFAPEFIGELLTLPTAASALGAHGQRFATDLWIRNTSAVGRRFGIRMACPAPCSQNPLWIEMNLGARETRVLADVVRNVLGAGSRDRAGAIEIAYDPREGAIDVFARVATANEDRPGNGTAIPARRREDARTLANFFGFSGLGGDAGFRVNAGAFNPHDRETLVTFHVRDAAGNDLGTVERTWGAREWFQINDVLAAAGVPPEAAASLFVDTGLPVHPFAIAIDNRSGDPTWLEPAPARARH
ncbi:MAG: hypothetical protein ACM369_15585 [Acidobacteriota bacterium]